MIKANPTNEHKEKKTQNELVSFTYSDALHRHAKRNSQKQCSVLVFDLDIFV